MAILGSLLEENDVDGEGSRAPTDDVFHTPGEHTDMEITRVGVYTSVNRFSILPCILVVDVIPSAGCRIGIDVVTSSYFAFGQT